MVHYKECIKRTFHDDDQYDIRSHLSLCIMLAESSYCVVGYHDIPHSCRSQKSLTLALVAKSIYPLPSAPHRVFVRDRSFHSRKCQDRAHFQS